MPINKWYVGQTRPIWSITATQDPPATGGPATPLNLAGSTITLHYKLTDAFGNETGSDIPGVNAGVITDAPNGKFTLTPAATDTFVTSAGTYLCQFFYDYGGGGIIKDDKFSLIVVAAD